MTQPVQTRVPVLVQEEAEQVAVEDIVANNENLKLGVQYQLAHSTMVLYAVRTHGDMIGRGLVPKGGLIKHIQNCVIFGFCTQNDTPGHGLIWREGLVQKGWSCVPINTVLLSHDKEPRRRFVLADRACIISLIFQVIFSCRMPRLISPSHHHHHLV